MRAVQGASSSIGQVMGFNFKSVGFATVNDMVAAMVKDENALLLAVANFIKENNLAGALQRKNWVSFARGYNAPDFKKNESTHEFSVNAVPATSWITRNRAAGPRHREQAS